ncbi:hypothetical protein HY624_03750 [Candidatus Uhrbacteria bacterium]|nr:hypothetical protein [Candidatus Uhrbacteria bacterium]
MMTRHVLIGRLGSTDRGRVAANSTATKINVDLSDNAGHLVGGMGEALDTLSGLGIKPTEIAIDLLVLAALVYAADTRVNRGMSSQDSWSREFDLIVPVSNPNVWIEHTKLLERTLAFLTGDIWSIDFRRRPTRFRTLSPVVNAALKLERSHDCVCLFSGGLDSFVGVLNLLREGRRPLLVSHAGDGTTSFIQKNAFGI